MARVFISHSSHDTEAAQELFGWLKSQGFERGFLDIDTDQGIPPGAKWEQTLYEELERAEAVILLLTRNWFDSKWCFAEFAQARSRGKAIFPVIVSPDGDQYIGDDLQKLDLTHDRAGGLDRLGKRLTEVALLSQSGFDFPAGRAPYPGFLAFDEDDAAIYFGRDDDVRRLVQRLDSRRIEGGRRFVLVLGELGTGKSSLLRAGLVPRLKRAKRDWIVLPVFRPERDPFAGLAASLRDAGIGISGEALAAADPARLALQIGEAHAAHRAGILVAVDQMEELFTRAEPRHAERFLAFLSGLLGPGLPFVAVATMRSDHLGDMQTATGLATEFEEFSLRPLPIERIGEIIRGPARIANLTVEESLVVRITQDARTTDALPLVAFALRRLYDQFADDGKLQLVEYESLRDASAGLSPLETIVRDTASRVIDEARPSEDELKALREAFVPGLVKVNDEGGFVRQAASWDALPERSHRLITTLAGAEARLLVVREREGSRQVEVAHEALFRVWPLLVGWLDEEKEFLIGRNRLERALADWKALPKADCDRGLISGILLDRARQWLIEHPGRFSDAEANYVRSSDTAEKKRQAEEEEQRRALEAAKLRQAEIERDAAKRLTRRTRLAAAVLGVVAVLAIGTGVFAMRAEQHANAEAERATAEAARATAEAERASRNLDIAKSTLASLERIGDTMRAQGNSAGALAAYEETRAIRVKLASTDENKTEWQYDLAVGVQKIGDLKLASGDIAGALAAFEEDLATARLLASAHKNDTGAQHDLSISLEKVGNVKLSAGDRAGALAAYQESFDIRGRLVASDPTNAIWQRDLSVSLEKIGNVNLSAGDSARALAAYAQSLVIRRRLAASDPGNSDVRRDISVSLEKIGDIKFDAGDMAGAQAAYQEDLAIARWLANSDPGNAGRQGDVSISLEKIGNLKYAEGDMKGALAVYEESLTIRRRLVDADAGNAQLRRSLSVALEKIGNVKLGAGDRAGATAAYEESLSIRRSLSASNPGNTQWQRDLSVSLEKLGNMKFDAGDMATARADFAETLDIRRRLAALDPGNVQWQRDLAIAWEKLGEVQRQDNDQAGAGASYEASLKIRRALAAGSPDNLDGQRDLSVGLEKTGDIKMDKNDFAGAKANYDECLAIRRRLVSADPGNAGWQRDLSVALNKVGDALLGLGDKAAAYADYQEGMAIARKLAARDAGNTLWQTDVVVSLWKVQKASDKTDERKAALREGIAILQKLDGEKRLSSGTEAWITTMQNVLDGLSQG